MTPSTLLGQLAAFPQMTDLHPLLPAAAGVAAGLSVVGVHYLFRHRPALRNSAVMEKPPSEDPFVSGSPTEQRQAFRRQGNVIEVKIIDQTKNGQPHRGWVVNRSIGGLCLMVETPLDVDSKLNVRPLNAPPLAPWIEVIVKSCRESNPAYEVGCQFVRTPPWALLLMFG